MFFYQKISKKETKPKFNRIATKVISFLSPTVAVFTVILLCLFPQLLNAVTVRNFSISPLNRLNIKFDKLPTVLENSLSDDKKSITINLGNVDFSPAQSIITGEGIINQAEFRKNGDQTILTLTLTDRRGYTVASLPFSQSLLIDVFDWNNLNPAEDSYRTGLLSLSDGLTEAAKPELLLAVQGDVADASSFLGFTLLSEGKINSALKYLQFAEIQNTSINDSYAALSQIYSIKKNAEKTENYAKLYKEKTKEATVPTIIIPVITETGDAVSDTNSYVDNALNKHHQTSETVSDSAAIDTNKSAEIMQDSLQTNESIWEAEDGLLTKYAIGIAVALILGIVYLYLKWRNKQLLILQAEQAKNGENANNNINNNAETTNSNSKGKSANNQEKIVNNKTNSKEKNADFGSIINKKMQQTADANYNGKNVTVSPQDPKNRTDSSAKSTVSNPMIQKNAENLLNYIENIKNEDVVKSDSILQAELKSENLKATQSAYKIHNNKLQNSQQIFDEKSNKNIVSLQQEIQRKKSANIELAEHLANEQKKLKDEKLSNLPNMLNANTQKIDDIAKKLGIEKSSLETKQNLDSLSNEEQFSKLLDKFGMKK